MYLFDAFLVHLFVCLFYVAFTNTLFIFLIMSELALYKRDPKNGEKKMSSTV